MDIVPKNCLKQIRLAKGLTAKALAEKLDVSAAQVSRWENSRDDIPGRRLSALKETYGTTIAEIYGEVAAPDTPATAWEPDLALLTKTIEGALPYVWAGQGDPDIAPKVAQMIAAVSHAVAMNPAILDTEASTAQAVQVVGVSIFGGPPPPTPSKPSTQRHTKGNS